MKKTNYEKERKTKKKNNKIRTGIYFLALSRPAHKQFLRYVMLQSTNGTKAIQTHFITASCTWSEYT